MRKNMYLCIYNINQRQRKKMKKEYQMPSTTVIEVKMRLMEGPSNTVQRFDANNAGLKFGGSSTNDTGGGSARSRGGSDWDDE